MLGKAILKYRISVKIFLGYTLLATMLVVSAWLVYDNSRSIIAVNNASEQLVKRRDVVDSLVCSMLEVNNAERSVLFGNGNEWPHFERSLSVSVEKARRLKLFLADSTKSQRLDSLVQLMIRKRDNTRLVMNMIADNSTDTYLQNKVKALKNGSDSVIIHPKTHEKVEHHETVYEIERSKRGFFRRLADAFRRQHTDTVAMQSIARTPQADSIGQNINIADSVANVLANIRREEQMANSRQQDKVALRMKNLQQVSLMLSERTGMLLEDIQHDEHHALQQAVNGAMQSRRTMVARIVLLGLLSVFSAAVLLWFTLRDIKREQRDHRRILHAKAETENLMRQRERLMLTITHDIKAPAASIAGFIELLQPYVTHPKATSYISNIKQSAKHLQQLVSALLDYHLLESGKAEIHCANFVPAHMAEECVGEYMPLVQQKGLQLSLHVSDACRLTWRGDAFRLKQVLANLLGNAVKYTDKGFVRVDTDIRQQHIVMTVSDSGCGISKSDQRHIYEAFARLSNAQGREGVGLGLSITHEIVMLLGGSIHLSSTEGQGTRFVVSIPVVHDSQQTLPTAPHTAMPAKGETAICQDDNTAKGKCTLNILAVDDDALQLQLLGEMLENINGADIHIHTTQNADEAVDIALKTKPTVIFTDIEMPQASGYDMLQRFRCIHAKTVAMTAHDKSIEAELRKAGFDACLFKPFSTQTLAATLVQITGLTLSATTRDIPCNDAFFAPLTAFAEGDRKAQNDILVQVAHSLDEYISLLSTPATEETPTEDTNLIAKAAHKALPLLSMLQPEHVEWLLPLTPEHINNTAPEERRKLALQLKKELMGIRSKLNGLGII